MSEAEQRLAWRKALTETDCRSMAAEFLRGNTDPACVDAHAEYKARFGHEDAHPMAIKKSKGTGRKPGRPRKGDSSAYA